MDITGKRIYIDPAHGNLPSVYFSSYFSYQVFCDGVKSIIITANYCNYDGTDYNDRLLF